MSRPTQAASEPSTAAWQRHSPPPGPTSPPFLPGRKYQGRWLEPVWLGFIRHVSGTAMSKANQEGVSANAFASVRAKPSALMLIASTPGRDATACSARTSANGRAPSRGGSWLTTSVPSRSRTSISVPYPARNDRWNAAIVLLSSASAQRPRCEMTFTGWRVPRSA